MPIHNPTTSHENPFYRLPNKNLKVIFNDETASSVKVCRLKNPTLLWLNIRVCTEDPQFHSLGRDISLYSDHLVKSCGFLISDDQSLSEIDLADETLAYVDRYGGSGIGTNGGSGRAAILNGYFVKGLGRTPLIGRGIDPTHASGGAYLEESVRESIFSEIYGYEFPYASVPTIAIIDTGIVQEWNVNGFIKKERRVLLIRPNFIRPAHFERALFHMSSNPTDGSIDASRVRCHVRKFEHILGEKGFLDAVSDFFQKWSCQLAYGYIHRISLGGNTSSNICLDGKILDFGAASSLPSFASVTLVSNFKATGSEFDVVAHSIQNLFFYLRKFGNSRKYNSQNVAEIMSASWQSYLNEFFVQSLRLCGLRKLSAESILTGPNGNKVKDILTNLNIKNKKISYDILEFTPAVERSTAMDQVWATPTPKHFLQLRQVLEDNLQESEVEQCRFESNLKNISRPLLFREEMKSRIYNLAERKNLELSAANVNEIIRNEVVKNRRDAKYVPPSNSSICGFALGENFSILLISEQLSGKFFAAVEWASEESYVAKFFFDAEMVLPTFNGLIEIYEMMDDGIVLKDSVLIKCTIKHYL